MKIAALSDIHGNLPALEIVTTNIEQWQPDFVIVGGDIINRGPLSRDCLEWTLAREGRDGWQLVRGNHEDYVLEFAGVGKPVTGRVLPSAPICPLGLQAG